MSTAADLSKKRNVRAGHRGSATKTITRANELFESEHPEIDRLRRVKLALTEKVDVLNRLDSEILEMVSAEEVAGEIEQSDEFKDGIYDVLVKLDRLLVPATTTAVTTSPAPAVASHSSSASSQVKLPKLMIQPFSGELTEWTPFWESFRTAIHDNPALTAVEKFNYLRSLLKRTALDAVAGLSLSAANYQEAISILEKRFGSKQRIIAKHMDALMCLAVVTSHNDLKSLRRLYDGVELHTRSLKSLGVNPDSYGELLTSVLMNKLPHGLQLLVSRQISEDDWRLDTIMKALAEEIQARERATAMQPSVSRSRSIKEIPVSATLLTDSASGPFCSYCHQSHQSNLCQMVTQPQARKQLLLKAGRCFNCLRQGHMTRNCRSRARCTKCGEKHHVSICLKSGNTPETEPTPPARETSHPRGAALKMGTQAHQIRSVQTTGMDPTVQPFQPPTPTSLALWTCANHTVLLQTAQAHVFNPLVPRQSRHARIVLDSGSQQSFVTECLARELDLLPGKGQTMSVATFGSKGRRARSCRRVCVDIQQRDGQHTRLELLTVPFICEPISYQPVALCQDKFDHLANLDLANHTDGSSCLQVDILVGSDQYWTLATGETRRGSSGPVAIGTKLGWVLSGPVPTDSSSMGTSSVNIISCHTLRIDTQPTDVELHSVLKQFWELESLGIREDDKSILDKFDQSIQFVDGRYEVDLPWKDNCTVLPDNQLLCLKRLRGLWRRLRQSPPRLKEYDTLINDQLKNNIIEVVSDPDEKVPGAVHYIPHHLVMRPDQETTKLRIVYDASARGDGPSLNDCLHTGPKFNQKILDILLRLRTHRIALIADIEKAFLQISVTKKDRDSLRFLWVDDASKSEPAIVTYRFKRVPFGVTSSPFLLNATLQHHLHKFRLAYPKTVQKLSLSLYVDDVASGSETEAGGYKLYEEAKTILKDVGFNLRKFRTNSTTLQEAIDVTEALSNDRHVDRSSKVLGIQWDVAADKLVFDLGDIATKALRVKPTKRKVIGVTCGFYDPMGFLAPIVVSFKVLFQRACQLRLGWDDLLPPELLPTWKVLSHNLQNTLPISVPRCYFDGQPRPSSCALRGFCDASKVAYAAVVYLSFDCDGARNSVFVACKTRIAPLKPQTIPRLELLAALLLSRLMTSVTQALQPRLQLRPPQYYSDSQVVLYWIKGDRKEWKPFVQNRVKEIRRLAPPGQWHYCVSEENPADLPSRGTNSQQLHNGELWLHGPKWLKEHTTPDTNLDVFDMPDECMVEHKQEQRDTHTLFTVSRINISSVVEPTRFSSMRRLLRVTAQTLRCIHIWKSKAMKTKSETTDPVVMPSDIQVAEQMWIADVQSLLADDPKFPSWRQEFGLFSDAHGLWRCGGRLGKANFPFDTKHPILLYQQHHFTTLVVEDAHSRVKHSGVKETLTELRARYWIIRGRSFVRRILSHCVICKRFEGHAFAPPPPPPLPSFRVSKAPAFTYTGVDFAGPLYVKVSSCDASEKVWICLYTCCVIRAIHLEIVTELTTQAFIRCFKRFTARRGIPVKILSDNRLTFKAADKMISSILNHPTVKEYFTGVRVQWTFNLEKAPWWGGIFERMVKSVKRCLRKSIGRRKLGLDELHTLITEVEAIVNSRPLSHISTEDAEEPVTPSHLICGRRLLSLPDGPYHEDLEDDFLEHSVLTKRLIELNKVLDHFWMRWKMEYLLELRNAHRPTTRKGVNRQIHVGEVVIVQDTDLPRGFWKLGRVEALITGTDGKVRGASIRIRSPDSQFTHLQRPIQLLYPLEVTSAQTSSQATEQPGCGTESTSADVTPPLNQARPWRVAAQNASAIIRTLTQDD